MASWKASWGLAGSIAATLALGLGTGCSSAKKKTDPELSRLEGKRVALVEVQGEATARNVVEVALINQLVKRGTFIVVNKRDVEKARLAPEQDPSDWQGVAQRAGAQYALKANVLEFNAETQEGYSSETVEDSQLEEELGPGRGKTERLYKVKALEGRVRVALDFVELGSSAPDALRSAVAEASDRVEAEGKSGGIHLPPKLRFLERLCNQAFDRFFERYR